MDNCLTLDHEGVMGILPHREPILLVDTVSECVPMDHIEAALYIDPEWDVFRGHFPGAPVFPGVLSVECMAQAADIMLMTAEKYQGKTPLFAGIDKARFLRKISPGDQVTAKVKVASENEEKAIITCDAELYQADGLAAKATVTLAMR